MRCWGSLRYFRGLCGATPEDLFRLSAACGGRANYKGPLPTLCAHHTLVANWARDEAIRRGVPREERLKEPGVTLSVASGAQQFGSFPDCRGTDSRAIMEIVAAVYPTDSRAGSVVNNMISVELLQTTLKVPMLDKSDDVEVML